MKYISYREGGKGETEIFNLPILVRNTQVSEPALTLGSLNQSFPLKNRPLVLVYEVNM